MAEKTEKTQAGYERRLAAARELTPMPAKHAQLLMRIAG